MCCLLWLCAALYHGTRIVAVLFVPCHSVPFSFHSGSNHAAQSIPCLTLRLVPSRVISLRLFPFYSVPCHSAPPHSTSCHATPPNSISCHFMLPRFIPFHSLLFLPVELVVEPSTPCVAVRLLLLFWAYAPMSRSGPLCSQLPLVSAVLAVTHVSQLG